MLLPLWPVFVCACAVAVIGSLWLPPLEPVRRRGIHRFPAGTRAAEAQMSLGLIGRAVEARRRRLAGEADGARRARIEAEIHNLIAQAALHEATVRARDLAPGEGVVGYDPDRPDPPVRRVRHALESRARRAAGLASVIVRSSV